MSNTSMKMRVIHRYLGFFLAGIMAMYAISGIILVFRNDDTFKKTTHINRVIETNIAAHELGPKLKIKGLKITKTEGPIMHFKDGTYNSVTGEADYFKKDLPMILKKMTHIHKATTKDPLYYLNIFFGISLLFFVVSSFWMFMPGSSVFRKGMYFTLGGIVLTLIMLFI